MALVVSLALHLLVVWLMLLSPPAGLPGGGSQGQGTGVGEGTAVTLVSDKVDVLAIKTPVADPTEVVMLLAVAIQPDTLMLDALSPDIMPVLSPPEVSDATAKVDNRSLNSEAKALTALAACGKYPMAEGRNHMKVNFPRP